MLSNSGNQNKNKMNTHTLTGVWVKRGRLQITQCKVLAFQRGMVPPADFKYSCYNLYAQYVTFSLVEDKIGMTTEHLYLSQRRRKGEMKKPKNQEKQEAQIQTVKITTTMWIITAIYINRLHFLGKRRSFISPAICHLKKRVKIKQCENI